MKRVWNVSICLIRSGTLPSNNSPPSAALHDEPLAQLRSEACTLVVISHFAVSMMDRRWVIHQVYCFA
jgi:hypothetical protein